MKTIQQLLDTWNTERNCDTYDHIKDAGQDLADRLEALQAGRAELDDE